jgi:hypothetical protein
MKPGHAAALALLFWYQMIPPTRGTPAEILYNAPLSQWEVGNQWETEAECENDIPSARDAEEMIKQCTNSDCAVAVKRFAKARCLFYEDPRLKGNPSSPAN